MKIEALKRRDSFLALRDRLAECRSELVDGLSRLGFRVKSSECIAVLATHPRHPAQLLQDELAKRGIAVRRFSDAKTANYVRITVGPRPVVERVLRSLEEIVEDERQPIRSGP